MITSKKGDLWKAVVLVALISAVVFASVRVVLSSGARPRARARSPQGTASAAAPASGREMFAQREHPTSELLTRSRKANDPFKGYVTAAAAAPSPPHTTSGDMSKPALAPPPLHLAAGQPELRLVGLVSGDRPLAVIAGDGTRYFVRVGDSLPSGWRLSKLARCSVSLTRGSENTTLTLEKHPPST